ncbi:hypothetical protein TGDOM2_398790 [Toxoplasma gondii GAB2-2007-GAL-DOM2]|uniref:Uncharacterized protein n=1 Tax=Toxoplasma gondii GAB2-2007-GAL-DOM2 TaxID=1130820 RepID=A0A086KE61_TOXGO|nr:hypothetical protein TGDOM2_398790 [Toxoplasma gondii GAB2-2007-GAL-DOM2]
MLASVFPPPCAPLLLSPPTGRDSSSPSVSETLASVGSSVGSNRPTPCFVSRSSLLSRDAFPSPPWCGSESLYRPSPSPVTPAQRKRESRLRKPSLGSCCSVDVPFRIPFASSATLRAPSFCPWNRSAPCPALCSLFVLSSSRETALPPSLADSRRPCSSRTCEKPSPPGLGAVLTSSLPSSPVSLWLSNTRLLPSLVVPSRSVARSVSRLLASPPPKSAEGFGMLPLPSAACMSPPCRSLSQCKHEACSGALRGSAEEGKNSSEKEDAKADGDPETKRDDGSGRPSLRAPALSRLASLDETSTPDAVHTGACGRSRSAGAQVDEGRSDWKPRRLSQFWILWREGSSSACFSYRARNSRVYRHGKSLRLQTNCRHSGTRWTRRSRRASNS